MAQLDPVKRLMVAVLERAVSDLQTYATVPTGRGRRLFTEVDAWFRSSTDGPFGFETICQATDLDPDFIRKGLRSSYAAGAAAVDQRGTKGQDRGAHPLAIRGPVNGSVGLAALPVGSRPRRAT